MATKTFWLLGTTATSPDWGGKMQDGGTAPGAATPSYGWSLNPLEMVKALGLTHKISSAVTPVRVNRGPSTSRTRAGPQRYRGKNQ